MRRTFSPQAAVLWGRSVPPQTPSGVNAVSVRASIRHSRRTGQVAHTSILTAAVVGASLAWLGSITHFHEL